MYEERQRFSLKDLILQLLFVVLFVFILVWLFPTKDMVQKMDLGNNNNTNNFNYDVLTNRIFNENIQTMKEAAQSYYTTPRLPDNVGESVKMTLGEMLKKNLLIEFTDANGKTCDHEASYVEITKHDDEYQMKVNLKCTDNDAYIIVYMGCYNYCKSEVCERADAKAAKPVANPSKVHTTPAANPSKSCTTCNQTVVNNNINITTNVNVTTNITKNTTVYVKDPTYTCRLVNGQYWGKNATIVDETTYNKECKTEPDPTYTCQLVNGQYWGKNATIVDEATYNKECSTPTPTNPIYACEYQKVINGYFTDWSNWSNWSETKETADNTKQVQTKNETVKKTVKTLIGYKTSTYENKEKPIYTAVQVESGTESQTVCAEYKNVTVGTGQYTNNWVSKGIDKYYSTPSDTANTKYIYVGSGEENCGNCSNSNFEYYEKYVRESKEITTTKKECARYETKTVPKYTTVNKITGYETYEVKTGIYAYKEQEVATTYYRYRTRSLVKGTILKKWSVCDDKSLLNDNYSLTGNRRQVN